MIPLCATLTGARQPQLVSRQPVINVKFNGTDFHLLPRKSSPPARERSDCFGVSSSLCCCPQAGVIFLSSVLSALWPCRLLCNGRIKDSPWKGNSEQRKGNFGEDCRSYVRSNQSPMETAKKMYRHKSKGSLLRQCPRMVLIASGSSAWLPTNPLCTLTHTVPNSFK